MAVQAKATDTLVSSDVVGYTQTDVPYKTTLIAPTFNNVTEKTLLLADMKPSRTSGDDIASGDIQMQTLDEDGATEDMIVYMTEEDVGKGNAGWYYDDGETPYAKEFDFGEGIVISSEYDDVKMTCAGAVDSSSTTIPVPYKTTVLGNTRPAPLSLANIVPARTSGDDIASGDIQMQTLDEDGATEDMIVYMTEEDVGKGNAGWYYDDGETPYVKTLAIGEAIVISSEYDDAYLTIPAIVTE